MEIIQHIIKALNLIEVKGADNLDRLLASIQALERLDKAFEQQEEQGNDDHDEPGQNVHGPLD